MANMISGVISLVLAIILIVQVVVPTVKSANTTSFTSGELAVFGLISLIAIFGLVYGAASLFGLV